MKKKYILFLIPLILYLVLLSLLPQMEPDEARYSLIASAMNESGNYVTPHIKSTIYLEKPPLVSWATAISFKLFGENDFSARLFSALCAWGCIWLVYFIGRHFRDEKTGLYAAAVLTVSCYHFFLGRINILDMPLTFFICLAIWLGYLALQRQNKKHLFYLFYFVCALAFLTKGIIGVVFPFGILIIWLIWTGQWRKISLFFSPVGILIFLITVCPWLILAQKENSDFLWFFFVREHFLRFTTKMHGKTEPFYFYLPILIGGVLPWAVYLIQSWKNKYLAESLFQKDDNKLLLVWLLFIFVFYTISSSKLPTYIAPMFLPIALFAGCIFKKYEENISLHRHVPVSEPSPASAGFRAFTGMRRSPSSQPCYYEENIPSGEPSGKKIIFRLAVIIQSLILIIALFLPPIFQKYSDAEKGLVIMISGYWWLYIILPVMALILMTFLPDLIVRKFRKGWFFTIYILAALFLGSILFAAKDFLAPYRSSLVAKEAISRYVPKGRDLYQYRVNVYGIDFYNKIRTPIVEDFGELSEGIVKLAPEEKKRYFLSPSEFFALCGEQKDIYCITQHQERLKEIRKKMPKTEVLWDNRAFYLLHIRN